MTLDQDPTDQLLDRHGERWRTTFVAPPLEGMLAVATAPTHHRTRWLWPLVAAVALLVVPLVTVIGVSGVHRPPGANHPAGFLGDVEWAGAVLQTDTRMLTVAVDVNRTPNYCLDYGVPGLRAVVSETATTVSIRAQAFRPSHPSPTPSVPAGSMLGCSLVGHVPVPVTVRLRQPLGSRSLIDATTRTRHPVLEASTLLTPSQLPVGYVDRDIRWEDDDPQGQVLHEYDGPGAKVLVVRGHGFPTPPDEQVLTTGTVLGHPAKVTTHATSPNTACVVWNDSEYSWTICSLGAPDARHAPLSAEELLRIGNSMR